MLAKSGVGATRCDSSWDGTPLRLGTGETRKVTYFQTQWWGARTDIRTPRGGLGKRMRRPNLAQSWLLSLSVENHPLWLHASLPCPPSPSGLSAWVALPLRPGGGIPVTKAGELAWGLMVSALPSGSLSPFSRMKRVYSQAAFIPQNLQSGTCSLTVSWLSRPLVPGSSVSAGLTPFPSRLLLNWLIPSGVHAHADLLLRRSFRTPLGSTSEQASSFVPDGWAEDFPNLSSGSFPLPHPLLHPSLSSRISPSVGRPHLQDSA